MRERPIPFNGPMVRAILECRKTQTRRVVVPQSNNIYWNPVVLNGYGGWVDEHGNPRPCKYGGPGDRLWLKEAFYVLADLDNPRKAKTPLSQVQPIHYAVNVPDRAQVADYTYKPPMFMPRWASRILLEITDVRAERVQDISQEDAGAEGVEPLFTEQEIAERPELAQARGSWKNYLWHGNFGPHGLGNSQSDAWPYQYSSYESARDSFSSLWHLINAARGYGWDASPWVWAITFWRAK